MKINTSTIIPIITYSLGIKLFLTKTQSSMLLSLERRAQRIIGTNVNSIESMMKKHTVLLVFKCLNGNGFCNGFGNYFDKIEHGKNTRNAGKSLRLPKCSLEYSKRSFYFLEAKFFNELPIGIREEKNLSKFLVLINKYFKQ